MRDGHAVRLSRSVGPSLIVTCVLLLASVIILLVIIMFLVIIVLFECHHSLIRGTSETVREEVVAGRHALQLSTLEVALGMLAVIYIRGYSTSGIPERVRYPAYRCS
jgi:hypothetical protein